MCTIIVEIDKNMFLNLKNGQNDCMTAGRACPSKGGRAEHARKGAKSPLSNCIRAGSALSVTWFSNGNGKSASEITVKI